MTPINGVRGCAHTCSCRLSSPVSAQVSLIKPARSGLEINAVNGRQSCGRGSMSQQGAIYDFKFWIDLDAIRRFPFPYWFNWLGSTCLQAYNAKDMIRVTCRLSCIHQGYVRPSNLELPDGNDLQDENWAGSINQLPQDDFTGYWVDRGDPANFPLARLAVLIMKLRINSVISRGPHGS